MPLAHIRRASADSKPFRSGTSSRDAEKAAWSDAPWPQLPKLRGNLLSRFRPLDSRDRPLRRITASLLWRADGLDARPPSRHKTSVQCCDNISARFAFAALTSLHDRQRCDQRGVLVMQGSFNCEIIDSLLPSRSQLIVV